MLWLPRNSYDKGSCLPFSIWEILIDSRLARRWSDGRGGFCQTGACRRTQQPDTSVSRFYLSRYIGYDLAIVHYSHPVSEVEFYQVPLNPLLNVPFLQDRCNQIET